MKLVTSCFYKPITDLIVRVQSIGRVPSISTEPRSNTQKGRTDSTRDRRSQSLGLESTDNQVNRPEQQPIFFRTLRFVYYKFPLQLSYCICISLDLKFGYH